MWVPGRAGLRLTKQKPPSGIKAWKARMGLLSTMLKLTNFWYKFGELLERRMEVLWMYVATQGQMKKIQVEV